MSFEIFNEQQLANIEKLAELPTYELAGVPVIKMDNVDREWERGLSDILFRIMGFSQFFSVLAFQCKYHWTVGIPTAGAVVMNGKFHIMINPVFLYEFLEKGSYQAFVIVHEVYHIFFDHTERRYECGYDPMLWNIACDHYIHHKLNEMINSDSGSVSTQNSVQLIPQDVFPICFDDKYKGMTEDEIYKTFEQQMQQQQQSQGDGSEGDSDEEQGDGSGSGNQSDSGSQSGSTGNGQKALDETPEAEQGSEGNSTTNKTAVARAVNAAVASAMQHQKQIGDAEAGIIREFADLTKPKVDWKSELQDKMESVRDQQITYAHFNRRSNEEVIFPSKTGEYINVFFGVDSSGSMSPSELSEAVSELQGIVNQLDSWDITVATCDTKAYPVAELSSDEDDELTEELIELKGGGGTSLEGLIEYPQQMDEDEQPQIIIILTDGYVPVEPLNSCYEHEIPVLFVISSEGSKEALEEHFDCIQLDG